MEIVKQIDELTQEVWNFCFINGNLYLDSYFIKKRENNKKRVYRCIKNYDRIYSRNNNITEDEVPLPEEIKQEALRLFTSSIKVLKWSERNNH